MKQRQFDQTSRLDSARISGGADRCRTVFLQIARTNRCGAAALLNDRRTSFACLYLLLPQVDALRLQQSLSARNAAAARIVRQICGGPDVSFGKSDLLSKKNPTVYPVLQWMLKTGCDAQIDEDDYEQVLDVTASALVEVYQDNSVLPFIDKMIFSREKKGRNIHDLAWTLFRLRDPAALRLVAQHLNAPDPKENALAGNLLHIEGGGLNENEGYEPYLRWLEENNPFLYFTGESLQFSSHPVPCRVDFESKYLNRRLPSHAPQPAGPANGEEERILAAFKPLSDEEKELLSGYSSRVRSRDAAQWKRWMQAPVDEQVKTARAEWGDAQWL